jgi:hypothetical protein
MTERTWADSQLKDFDATENLLVRCSGIDGRLDRGVPVWVVVIGGGVYVRAYQGVRRGWFRRAIRLHQGAVGTTTTQLPAQFEGSDGGVRTRIDAAYRLKYGHYSYVSSMLTAAAAATLRISPHTAVHSGQAR